MAINTKNNHSVWMLLLITLIGLVLGSYISLIIDQILLLISGDSVGLNPISFFTKPLTLRFGYHEPTGVDLSTIESVVERAKYLQPYKVDLGVIKFNFGLQLDINLISFLGVWLSHKFFKSYK